MEENINEIVSAYKDNVAFIKGPRVEQFAPKSADVPDYYESKEFESVISLKAETHNFPTTVEPFNGAATGSGGEIRDRLAGTRLGGSTRCPGGRCRPGAARAGAGRRRRSRCRRPRAAPRPSRPARGAPGRRAASGRSRSSARRAP